MNLEFRYRFEAAHRFLKSDSIPCMTPHGHTWYATMGVHFKGSTLNSSQMSVEFSQVKKDWKDLVQGTFDHSYMHNINDPIIEVLKTGGACPRLIPFPGDPTTELISLFLFHKINLIIEKSEFANKLNLQFIRLEETPTNSIVCSVDFYKSEMPNFANHSGWWTSLDTADRSFHGNL